MLALTAETRAWSLAAMAEGILDVLVIGGGITGAVVPWTARPGGYGWPWWSGRGPRTMCSFAGPG